MSGATGGVVTPEHRWTDSPMPVVAPDGRIGPADAVRAATAIVRGERIRAGHIAESVKSGLFDAVAVASRTWHARTPTTQDGG